MGAIANLWNSEKGLLALLALVGTFILAALGTFTSDQAIEFAKWIFAFYVGGKTVQGGVQAIASAMRPATTTVVATPEATIATSEAKADA